MKAGDLIGGDVNSQGTLWGFSITLAGLAFEVYSAHCSSPWTSETFGADPKKAKSAMKYVYRSAGMTVTLGLGGVLLTKSLIPLYTTSAVSAYMIWTYKKAITTAQESNQGNDWGK
jgi:hypothetical protein